MDFTQCKQFKGLTIHKPFHQFYQNKEVHSHLKEYRQHINQALDKAHNQFIVWHMSKFLQDLLEESPEWLVQEAKGYMQKESIGYHAEDDEITDAFAQLNITGITPIPRNTECQEK